MKKIYRFSLNSDYWDNRWRSSGVDNSKFQRFDFYPIKQTESFLKDYNSEQSILELGCGAGRLFFHYRNRNYNIKGIEYSSIAVENIQKLLASSEDVVQGNVLSLPYKDESFDYILALGLFHNLESIEDIEEAFYETSRVMKKNGKLLFSVRYDSLENNIIENIIRKRNKDKVFDKFHRYHFDLENTSRILKNSKLVIKNVEYVRNVSFLFKYDFFRSKDMKSSNFVESEARAKGFELNFLGRVVDRFLHSCFPKKFSNLLILSVEKNDEN